MKGEHGFKLFLGGLFCVVLLLGNVSYFVLAQNATPTGPNVSLPSMQDAQSFWQKIKDGLSGTFEAIKKFGEGNGWFESFFEKTGQKISTWWSIQARPWLNNAWYNINNYLNQEIRIN